MEYVVDSREGMVRTFEGAKPQTDPALMEPCDVVVIGLELVSSGACVVIPDAWVMQ